MALYLGNQKIKVIQNNLKYNFNIGNMEPKIDGIILTSKEGYILIDKNGLYLTAKEDN